METEKQKEALFEALLITLAKVMVNMNYGEHKRPTGWPQQNSLPSISDIPGLELSVHIFDASRNALDILLDTNVAAETSSTTARINKSLNGWSNAYFKKIDELQAPLDKAISIFIELCGGYVEPMIHLGTETFQPPEIYNSVFDCFKLCGYAQHSISGVVWTDKMGPFLVRERAWRFEKREQQREYEEECARKNDQKITAMAASIPKPTVQQLLKKPESEQAFFLANLLARHWDGTEFKINTDMHSMGRFAMFSANGDSKKLLKKIKG